MPRKPQRKVWLFASAGRSPGGVDCGGGGGRLHPERWRSLGDFSRAVLLLGRGCTRVTEERRLRTRQPGGAGVPKACRTTPTQLLGWRPRGETITLK